MANTTIPVELSSTPGIVDNSNATAITIDSSENVGIGTSSPSVNTEIRGSASNGQLRLGGSTTATYANIYSDNDGVLILGADAGNNAASSYFGVEVDGTERLRIDSSGNVGIGNTVASTINSQSGYADLVVGTGSGENGTTIYSGSNGVLAFANGTSGTSTYKGFMIYAHGDNTMRFGTDATERMRIDSLGNVGIGTSSPGSKLSISDSGTGISLTNAASGNFNIGLLAGTGSPNAYIFQRANAPLLFGTNNTERMRIDSSGNLLVGTTGTITGYFPAQVQINAAGNNGIVAKVTTAGEASYNSWNSAASGTRYHISFYDSATRTLRGTITSDGSVMIYGGQSDYRLKENITPITNAITKINNLNPVNFDWKESGVNSDGFLAHEAQTVIPYAVTGVKDEVNTGTNLGEEQTNGEPKYQMMDYAKLVPLLTAALQEQQALIEDLKSRLTAGGL